MVGRLAGVSWGLYTLNVLTYLVLFVSPTYKNHKLLKSISSNGEVELQFHDQTISRLSLSR